MHAGESASEGGLQGREAPRSVGVAARLGVCPEPHALERPPEAQALGRAGPFAGQSFSRARIMISPWRPAGTMELARRSGEQRGRASGRVLGDLGSPAA
jgi:hypothetical protein